MITQKTETTMKKTKQNIPKPHAKTLTFYPYQDNEQPYSTL